jgi:hypothetical protein
MTLALSPPPSWPAYFGFQGSNRIDMQLSYSRTEGWGRGGEVIKDHEKSKML